MSVDPVRLDAWLDVACLFKTRSEAQKACKLGKVSVNGQVAKPHRSMKVGDELVINRPMGRKQLVTVLGLADKHVSKADARLLYEDRTPKPTAEEIEVRRLERVYRAAATPKTRPDRDMRRTLRRLKRGE
jgi:ribosome-associated heat shock protein Hsp15